MDLYEKSLKEKRFHQSQKNPSFSSSLLDAIYCSIDKGEEAELVFYKETMRKKQSTDRTEEKKKPEKLGPRRKPSDSGDGFRKSQKNQNPILSSSNSSSSESSYGGFGFSSSEAESLQTPRPKPIRTGFVPEMPFRSTSKKNQFPEIQVKEKPKTAASKIYSDLKKPGQPISPGGRIASFLNSLFASNSKKAKIDHSRKNGSAPQALSSSTTPTCSSASSYSRSCLSKTPSSRGNSNSTNTNGSKRSVRFYPITVIVDEDCRPCGQKRISDRDPTVSGKIGVSKPLIGEELKLHLMEKSRRIEEAAKDLLKGYQKKSDFLEEVMRSMHDHGHGHGHDDNDDDGYSSSDLFELEMPIQRYREELPVYETTRFETNRAIASGLIR
ncbi:protein BIG GRAIN 1-like B [Magnolia sinica]|uniref:protein BIG GRAIN 1-like B n=1 Tax=Magnolia sinica TaxID=86752 RepID=UPI002659A553|nr:protein BIG GRAIN 1-like B [Magnolia sinica]